MAPQLVGIFKIASHPDGLVSVDQLRSAFNHEVIYNPRTTAYEVSDFLRQLTDYSTNNANGSSVFPTQVTTFDLERAAPGLCINAKQVVNALAKAGWSFVRDEPEQTLVGPEGLGLRSPERVRFLKGSRGYMTVVYNADCPRYFYLNSDRRGHDH